MPTMNPSIGKKILALPAYTTLLCQAFSPSGDHLAVGSDRGRIAIFRTSELVTTGRNSDNSNGTSTPNLDQPTKCIFFDVTDDEDGDGFSINTLTSIGGYLIAGVSGVEGTSTRLIGWAWKALLKQVAGKVPQPQMTWAIEGSQTSSVGNHSILPSDVNAVVVDEKSDAATAGRLFVAGGAYGSTQREDYAIRVIDLETRSEVVSPLKGHVGYIHDLSFNDASQILVSASEDGCVKVWDVRSRRGKVHDIIPNKLSTLARPHLGRWVGAVGLCGELLCCGGGPRPAIYHLRTLTPIQPEGLQLPEPFNAGSNLIGSSGGIHVAEFLVDENRILIGGELHSKVFEMDLSGHLISEIETSSSCLYSVAHISTESFKLLSLAGASSRLDLCTANFGYRDRLALFPVGL